MAYLFGTITRMQFISSRNKAVRTITHSHYIAYSEPLLKQLNLLNIKDMVDQKLLKFLNKLKANKLPAYFNSCKPY